MRLLRALGLGPIRMHGPILIGAPEPLMAEDLSRTTTIIKMVLLLAWKTGLTEQRMGPDMVMQASGMT